MNSFEAPVYQCIRRECDIFPPPDHPVWDALPIMNLTDTVTGVESHLRTTVVAFWNEYALYFRFTCNDSHVVATMQNHDDPIYNEDVVEAFISETGNLGEYKEFEVSPKNVKFDAFITNNLQGNVGVVLDWDAIGWQTAVYGDPGQGQLQYVWELPFRNFATGAPRAGDQWLFNCYRIDRGPSGIDEYLAWSPTGIVNFHMPEKFGWLRFK